MPSFLIDFSISNTALKLVLYFSGLFYQVSSINKYLTEFEKLIVP